MFCKNIIFLILTLRGPDEILREPDFGDPCSA